MAGTLFPSSETSSLTIQLSKYWSSSIWIIVEILFWGEI